MFFFAVYLVTRAADDGWEHGPGGIVSGEASLHQAGTVVAHKGGSFLVVTHVGFCERGGTKLSFQSTTLVQHSNTEGDRNHFQTKALLQTFVCEVTLQASSLYRTIYKYMNCCSLKC